MKFKFIFLLLFLYSQLVTAMFGFSTDKKIYQKAAKSSIQSSCGRTVQKYTNLVTKYSNSKYYKWQLNNWIDRCNKENIKTHRLK